TIGGGHGGLGAIVLDDVTVAGAPGQPPLLTVKHARIPLGVVLGMHSAVRLEGLRIAAVKGGAADNVSAIAERLRGHGHGKSGQTEGGGPSSSATSSSSVPDIVIADGALDARDEGKHVQLKVGSFDAELRPGAKLALHLRGVHGVLVLGAEGEGPSFSAD